MLDGCARRLEYLYLGGNRLARVPDAIGALSRLTYLNLSENLLEHVPPALGRLRQLRVLDLVLYSKLFAYMNASFKWGGGRWFPIGPESRLDLTLLIINWDYTVSS